VGFAPAGHPLQPKHLSVVWLEGLVCLWLPSVMHSTSWLTCEWSVWPSLSNVLIGGPSVAGPAANHSATFDTATTTIRSNWSRWGRD
jgi:hypothetical protein